ncbi:capsular polysaccharide export protein, LipB/KpsS family [Prosthecomicrobium sp. N25]|uniref:capsular polysaccharide export protein, LipB/KpsS family n=1 Tax=Prosthecomicrobium sp. N25 TaxID=3129254 RepID=UPI0030788FFF
MFLDGLRRFFRRTPSDDVLPDWYDSRLRPGPEPGGDPVFLYMPWIPEHGDALVAKIARGGTGIRFHPLDIVRDPDDVTARLDVLVFAQKHPDRWRRLVMRKLAPLASRVAGLVVSFDWHPVMRELVYACRSLGVPTYLVPHESVFIDEERYYVARNGASVPATDYALVWGGMQRRIFTERGYPADRVVLTGSPKFDIFHDYRPMLDRVGFAAMYGLDPARPIVLFAGQPLDSQVDSQRYALSRQTEAIEDLLDVAEDKGIQVVIRQPPAKKVILSNEQRSRIEDSTDFAIDGPVKFSLPPEEAIYHAAAILSVNSTMLFEAVLMGRPSISMPYFDFEQIWTNLDIARAPNRDELARLLGEAIEKGRPMVSEAGLEWANRELAAGRFDGLAAGRVSDFLAGQARKPRPDIMRPNRASEVFAGTGGQGSIALVSNRGSLEPWTPLLKAVFGAKRLVAEVDAQDAAGADYLLHFDQRYSDPDPLYHRHRRTLGRPELYAEPGFLGPGLARAAGGARVSVVVDDVAPYYETSRLPRLIRRLSECGNLSGPERARAGALIATLGARLAATGPKGSRPRILVVDQSVEDRSVPPGEEAEKLFGRMLRDLIRTAPEAEIVVGSVPADLGAGVLAPAAVRRIAGTREIGFEAPDRDGLHAYARYDAVHVATSDAGAIALLAGVPVHCHAAPFYAGWGLTTDHAPVPDRSRRLDLEQLFHVAWIEMSRYFDPKSGKACAIEDLVIPAPAPDAAPEPGRPEPVALR